MMAESLYHYKSSSLLSLHMLYISRSKLLCIIELHEHVLSTLFPKVPSAHGQFGGLFTLVEAQDKQLVLAVMQVMH